MWSPQRTTTVIWNSNNGSTFTPLMGIVKLKEVRAVAPGRAGVMKMQIPISVLQKVKNAAFWKLVLELGSGTSFSASEHSIWPTVTKGRGILGRIIALHKA